MKRPVGPVEFQIASNYAVSEGGGMWSYNGDARPYRVHWRGSRRAGQHLNNNTPVNPEVLWGGGG
jgi:hypothetical protein